MVSAVARWNDQLHSAEVTQYGQRMVMGEFEEFFRAAGDNALVPQLRAIYARIRERHPDLPPPGTKTAMIDAFHAYETEHPELCALRLSADKFYGFEGVSRLDEFLQWVFVPAVKDASSEQIEAKKTALGLLLERTVRSKMSFLEPLAKLRSEVEQQYQTLLNENQNALESLSNSLTTRLQEWAHPSAKLTLTWRNDPTKSVSIAQPLAEVMAGEGRFQGTLSRFGHGLQRSFLLALLQELSGCGNAGSPKLLLACEEPELYQHPPQARHLSSVLQKLSNANTQVIVSTHSPYFISAQGFKDVRVIRQELAENQPCIRSVSFVELSAKLAEALGGPALQPTGMELKVEQTLQAALNEMFFSPVLVLVEGLEDLAYISTQFILSDQTEEFRRLGCHIVPTMRKSNMIQPLAIARMFEIPTFVIFDGDGDDVDKAEHRAHHERDNVALLRLCSVPAASPFPTTIFQTPNLTVWPTNIRSVVREEFGKQEWERFEVTVRQKRRIADVPDLQKNALFIGHVLTEAHSEGKNSAVLEGVCNHIIAFARSARASQPRVPLAMLNANG